jgi:hypothetical protein
VFGEESGYTKAVMVIYTGSHYDCLAIAKVRAALYCLSLSHSPSVRRPLGGGGVEAIHSLKMTVIGKCRRWHEAGGGAMV